MTQEEGALAELAAKLTGAERGILLGLSDRLDRANRALVRISREAGKAFPGPCGMVFMVAIARSVQEIADHTLLSTAPPQPEGE